MISKQKIFGAFNILAIAGMVVFAAPARGASDGCDKEENDFINPVIALCSTHAYNIGMVTNPATAAERQDMNTVVALKTTVMTQQMYRQYENLEAVMRRLKTQLEKAVLVSRLQIAAGESGTSGTGGGGTGGASQSASLGRNIYLEGAKNCDRENTISDIIACIQSNIGIAEDNAAKNPNNAKKQLETDYKIAKTAGLLTRDKVVEEVKECKNLTTNKQKIEACASAFRTRLVSVVDSREREDKKK